MNSRYLSWINLLMYQKRRLSPWFRFLGFSKLHRRRPVNMTNTRALSSQINPLWFPNLRAMVPEPPIQSWGHSNSKLPRLTPSNKTRSNLTNLKLQLPTAPCFPKALWTRDPLMTKGWGHLRTLCRLGPIWAISTSLPQLTKSWRVTRKLKAQRDPQTKHYGNRS